MPPSARKTLVLISSAWAAAAWKNKTHHVGSRSHGTTVPCEWETGSCLVGLGAREQGLPWWPGLVL